MGGQHETVDTAALRTFAGRFESEVAARLTEAGTALRAGIQVEYPNFTTFAWTLATAYVEATSFVVRDLETKQGTVASFAEGLRRTADYWDRAEDASTVRTVN